MWFTKAMVNLPQTYVNVADFGYPVFRFFGILVHKDY
jgi:hypothetical protein